MAVSVRASPGWLGRMARVRHFRYARELLGLAVLLAGAGLLWHFSDELTGWEQMGGAAILVVTTAVFWRRGWHHIFSAVLFYDLIRSARGGRYTLLRCIYTGVILFTLFLLYWSWMVQPTGDPWRLLFGGGIDKRRVAEFTESFFHRFAIVQFVAVVVLTPACTAGALAEEKEKKTLEYLLTSNLFSHEIIFGKLLSRLAYLILVVLTGLPFLSLLQLLGGVDPNLVLGAFAVTGLTMLSLASLSIVNSLYATKPRTAIFLTYIEMTAYLLLSAVLPWSNGWGVSNGFFFDWFASGNIIVAIGRLFLTPTFGFAGLPGTTLLGTTLGDVLFDYALFHLIVAAACILWVGLRFRPYSRKFASRGRRRSFAVSLWQRRLPRIRTEPMLWKELHAEPTFRFNRTGMIATAVLLWSGLFFMLFLFLMLYYKSPAPEIIADNMNFGVRTLGTLVACIMLVAVGVRAANSVTGERDRLTLDSLLASTLEPLAILRAKWLGSVLCLRRGWWVLLAIWIAGVWTGGLSPLAVLLLAGAWLAYASFAAHVGLWFSVACRSTFRATVSTVIVLLLAGGGYWLLGFCCLSPLSLIIDERWTANLASLTYAYTPVGSFSALAIPAMPPPFTPRVESEHEIAVAVAGALAYFLVGWIFWFRARRRFARMTGRESGTGSRAATGRGGTRTSKNEQYRGGTWRFFWHGSR